MDIDEFAEMARGVPLSESDKKLIADLTALADLHDFKVIVVGGGYSLPLHYTDAFFGLQRPVRTPDYSNLEARMELELVKQREFAERMSKPGKGILRIRGINPNVAIFDDFDTYHMAYPTQLPADQVKGPKGPRGKWGKL